MFSDLREKANKRKRKVNACPSTLPLVAIENVCAFIWPVQAAT